MGFRADKWGLLYFFEKVNTIFSNGGSIDFSLSTSLGSIDYLATGVPTTIHIPRSKEKYVCVWTFKIIQNVHLHHLIKGQKYHPQKN